MRKCRAGRGKRRSDQNECKSRKISVHKNPPFTLHPRAWLRLRAAGRSTGLRVIAAPPPSRSDRPQWRFGGQLTAYSCGGSRGFRTGRHHVPVFRPECREPTTAQTIEPRPVTASTILGVSARRIDKPSPPLFSGPQRRSSHHRGVKRECGQGPSGPNSAAAPATVGGKLLVIRPLGGRPGKAAGMRTIREPGDLPSLLYPTSPGGVP
jgi:hypothetical protein